MAKKLFFAALMASVGLTGAFAPAQAYALPGQCWNSPFGGFCDTSPQADGSFNHCETVRYPFGSSSYTNCYQACHDPATNRAVMTDLDWTTPC